MRRSGVWGAAPAWICDQEFARSTSVISESKLGEKDARAKAVAQFRAVMTTHLINVIRESPDVPASDPAARAGMTELAGEAVAGFRFETRLDTLAKARSKGGVFYVAVGARHARVEEFATALLAEVFAKHKKGRGQR